MGSLYLFNQSYGILCQFSAKDSNLSNYIDIKNIYPAGCLDKNLKDLTKPTKTKIIFSPQWLWTRNLSIRIRENTPISWIELKHQRGQKPSIQAHESMLAFQYSGLLEPKLAISDYQHLN